MSAGRIDQQRDGSVHLAFGEVRIEDACADTEPVSGLPGGRRFTWPCPGCDRAQPVSSARTITVSDPPLGRNRRNVMICRDCATRVERITS